MLTNEIRSQIDQIWNAFWSGGISNPLKVVDMIDQVPMEERDTKGDLYE